ncbi:putative amidohydrolase [Neolewinella xylanilytica]|uniref:Putative amidohydrolase n=1 Tax=Neolewinella xylanilytica TaxID=1514080 RepID=A0A2S6IAH8_9BACT|nr:nitrilase-related carbon-nitrogen hydrolase [Neolewinella xylanilytica]PPK88495.1 putative amidohydrolase [Neolewinella xylanilytica]
MPPPRLNLATYQFDAELGAVDRNLDRIAEILTRLSPGETDIIAFPEMCDTGYAMDVIAERAVTWGEDHLRRIKSLAREKRTAILLGLSERENGRVHNTVAVIGKDGQLVHKYRKTHLVTIAPIHEERTITPGNELGYFEMDGTPCGVMTCYELRFPEIARALTLRGIQVLFVPTAWPLVRVDHLMTLVRARAIENQVFVVLASRVGTDAGTTFSGRSLIVDPNGNFLAEGSESAEELLRATIDPSETARARQNIRALSERRPELYE